MINLMFDEVHKHDQHGRIYSPWASNFVTHILIQHWKPFHSLSELVYRHQCSKLIMRIKIQSIISINSVEAKCYGNLIKVTFMTSLSRVLFREAESTLGRNCSSLKIDKIRKASSVEMSSLPCWPKLWKTRNYLSKTAAITNLRLSIHYMLKIRFPKYILFIFLISIVYA